MAGAAERLPRRARRGRVPPAAGCPVFSSTAAAPFADPRAGLAAALTEPVLWRRRCARMRAAGARDLPRDRPRRRPHRPRPPHPRRRRGALAGRAGGGPCLRSCRPPVAGRRRSPRQRAGAEIAGLGIAVPETVVANAPIAARLGIDESWIVQRTGIGERRVAAPERDASPSFAAAGRRARPRRRRDRRRRARPGPRRDDQQRRADARRRRRGSPPRSAPSAPARSTSTPPAPASSPALSLACGQIESGRAASVLAGRRRPDDAGSPTPTTAAPRRSSPTAPARSSCAAPSGAGSARSCSAPTAPTADLILATREDRADPDAGPRHLPPRGRPDGRGDARSRRRGRPRRWPRSTSSSTTRPTPASCARSATAWSCRRSGSSTAIGHYGNTSAASIPLALEDAAPGRRPRADGANGPARRLRRRPHLGRDRGRVGERDADARALRAARSSPAPRAGSAPRRRWRWPPTAGRCGSTTASDEAGAREVVARIEAAGGSASRGPGRRRRRRRRRAACSSPARTGRSWSSSTTPACGSTASRPSSRTSSGSG